MFSLLFHVTILWHGLSECGGCIIKSVNIAEKIGPFSQQETYTFKDWHIVGTFVVTTCGRRFVITCITLGKNYEGNSSYLHQIWMSTKRIKRVFLAEAQHRRLHSAFEKPFFLLLSHKILGPKNLSKSCQVDKFLTSQTRHHAGDEKDKLLTTQKIMLSKICQKFVKKLSLWQDFGRKTFSASSKTRRIDGNGLIIAVNPTGFWQSWRFFPPKKPVKWTAFWQTFDDVIFWVVKSLSFSSPAWWRVWLVKNLSTWQHGIVN